jgi:hypothetical protein
MTECVIVRITKADITRVIHDEPAFAELFIAHLLARNSRVEEDLVDQLFNSSEKRLARILLLLANFGKEGRPEPIIAKVSQETLAEMIGTTRSRVSFFMNKFRELGLIDYNGGIEVHSSLLNVVLHDQPQEQHVALSSVQAAFGGSRTYFLCPGAGCGQRNSILYFGRGSFRCRRCHGLAYASQGENSRQRARRRADKLRARLGWPQGRALVLPIVVKPKGMRRKNFQRLRRDAVAAESVATAAQVAHWIRLLGGVKRR